jgi:hypothetical protein
MRLVIALGLAQLVTTVYGLTFNLGAQSPLSAPDFVEKDHSYTTLVEHCTPPFIPLTDISLFPHNRHQYLSPVISYRSTSQRDSHRYPRLRFQPIVILFVLPKPPHP